MEQKKNGAIVLIINLMKNCPHPCEESSYIHTPSMIVLRFCRQ